MIRELSPGYKQEGECVVMEPIVSVDMCWHLTIRPTVETVVKIVFLRHSTHQPCTWKFFTKDRYSGRRNAICECCWKESRMSNEGSTPMWVLQIVTTSLKISISRWFTTNVWKIFWTIVLDDSLWCINLGHKILDCSSIQSISLNCYPNYYH